MAAVAISFNGTRVVDSDSATSWGNWGSSGPTPASEYPLAYQVTSGTTTGAVNKKITSGTLGGFDYDPGTGAQDMSTATGTKTLWFCKVYASDAFDLVASEGIRVGIGSANNAYTYYNIAGSSAGNSRYSKYPSQGGYLITAINPNISGWGTNSGSPTLTAIDWWGLQAAFVNCTAKSENLAMDAIDVGTGLTLTGGDGADADGTFISFVTSDQDTKANRWGVVTGSGDVVRANGMLTIGNSSATVFTDTTSIVLFPNGYHGTGDLGVTVNLDNATNAIQIDSLLIGEGQLYTTPASTDTRPDFIVSGTTGTLTSSGTLRNFNQITLTSACTFDGAILEFKDLTQSAAVIKNSTLVTDSASGVASINDATFGTTTGINNSDFVQGGSGHAIEITTAGDYTLTNIGFSGYGADTTNSAAIYVSASSGTVNIYVDADSPTYRTAGATVNIIANPVTVKVTTALGNGTAVGSCRVFLAASNGTGPFPFEEAVTLNATASTTVTVTHTAHGMATGDKVVIYNAADQNANGVFSITVTNANTYTYTARATVTLSADAAVATFVALEGLTNATTGILSTSRVYTSNQPVVGWTRKSTSSPYYKSAPIAGTISSTTGIDLIGVMIPDE